MNDTPNNTPSENAPGTPGGDPKLTAYALGELDPQSKDYRAIESQLADAPALREQVKAIAQLGEQLKQSYDNAASPGLDDAALSNLADVADPPAAPIARIHHKPSPARRLLPYAGVAACTALATASVFITMQAEVDPPSLTKNTEDPAVPAVAPQDEIEDTDPIQETREKLKQTISLNINKAPLHEVLNKIKQQTGVNMITNWPSLEMTGVKQNRMVSLQIDDLPAETVLKLLLAQASSESFDDDKIGSRVNDGYVQIDTRRSLKALTETQTYDITDLLTQQTILTRLKGDLFRDIALAKGYDRLTEYDGDPAGGFFGGEDRPQNPPRSWTATEHTPPVDPADFNNLNDLLAQVPNFSNAPGFDLNEALSNTENEEGRGGGGGGQGGGLFSSDDSSDETTGPTIDGKPLTVEQEEFPYDRQERIDELTELIQNTIGNPDEWLDEESTLVEFDGRLTIKTTPENHQALKRLMDKLAPAGQRIDPKNLQAMVDDVIRDVELGLIELEQRQTLRETERERRERFAKLADNPFKLAEHEPLSTFSVDVDTASYTYGRRLILEGNTLPMPDAVRIEEWINYFDYGYTAPAVDRAKLSNGRLTTAALKKLEAADESFVPFATDVEVVQCPWAEGHQLVRVGIKAMEVLQDERPPAHLVFLLDVSGSMRSPDKLELVQKGMPLLLDQLNDNDKVSIVVYAGASGLVLEAAEAMDKDKIKQAITQLKAGGGTAGGAGIKLAYDIAQKHFVTGGINRVILCTDGDFNVGTSDTDELVELVKAKANPDANNGKNKGVYLSVMGFGTGNLNDEMMEKITNAGNGNYYYIDSVKETVKTMSQQAGGTLITVAKDVKLQLEFNPTRVASYRLVGYENRVLRDEDFNNDTVDAGDIGAGHSVTALYEIVPAAAQPDERDNQDPVIDELRYQKPRGLAQAAELPELLTLKLRYKPVDAAAEQGTSRKVVKHVPADVVDFDKASEPTRFAASIAAMGMILRNSPHRGEATTQWVTQTIQNAKEFDPNGYREEFLRLATQVGVIETKRDEAFRKNLAPAD